MSTYYIKLPKQYELVSPEVIFLFGQEVLRLGDNIHTKKERKWYIISFDYEAKEQLMRRISSIILQYLSNVLPKWLD